MGLSRPGTVTAAAWLALACSGICLSVFTVLFVFFVLARDDLIDGVRDAAGEDQRREMDPGTAANVAIAVVVVLALWCLAAMAAAVLAMRRSRVGRWMLTVSAVASSVFSLIGTLTIVLPLVLLLAALAVVVMLFTPSANDWYARRGRFAVELPTGTTQPWG